MDKANESVEKALKNLNPIRQDLQKSKNREQNMVNLDKGLENLQESLTQQLVSLKGMKNIKKDIDVEKDEASQNKLQMESFLEAIERDILALVKYSKQKMLAPKNEKKTADLTEEAFWKDLEDKYRDKINEIKLNLDSISLEKNHFEIMFKYLNVRDALIIQTIKALMYQQKILCKDLNIQDEEFVHNEILKILSTIEQQEKVGFIKPKHTFEKTFVKSFETFKYEEITHDEKKKKSIDSLPITQYIELAGKAFDNLESLLRNYYGLSDIDKKEIAINTSQAMIAKLTQKLTIADKKITQLERLYLNGNIKVDMKIDDEELQEKEKEPQHRETNTVIKEAQKIEIENKPHEEFKKNQILEYNQLKIDYPKLRDSYFRKLDETVEKLRNTIEEVMSIKKEVGFFSSIFRAEKRDKTFLETEKKSLEDRMEKLAEVLGRFRNNNRLLKEEVGQKDKTCFELAKALEEYRTKLSQIEKEVEAFKKECKASKERETKSLKEQEVLQKVVFALQSQLKKDGRIGENLDAMIAAILEEKKTEMGINATNLDNNSKYSIYDKSEPF